MKIVPKGDATKPEGEGPKLIIHICNDIGAFGAGFVVAVARKWPHVRQAYLNLQHQGGYHLGDVQFVEAEPGIVVANMIAQHGVGFIGNTPPIRLEALRQCLAKVGIEAKKLGASVHLPPVGCGLAGSSWSDIGPIIQEELVDKGIEVTVYDRDEILS
jgi:O-acetyl-ADP-ribose deacetylase (regulator of RNase III)